MKGIIKLLTVVALTGATLFSVTALIAGEGAQEKFKAYPLKTCIVSGKKLGSMGEPYTFVHEGQEIKLCCKGCLKEFKKDSAKYLKKIADAPKEKN